MEETVRYTLFEIKQNFLQEIPHPKLILKQIGLTEAKGQLKPLAFEKELFLLEKAELIPFLENHLTQTLRLKMAIVNAANFDLLRGALAELYQNQMQLLQKLVSYLPQKSNYPHQHIKMSDPIDPYQILKRIGHLNLTENGINPYLCHEIENANETAFDVIVTSCLRAQKIVSHV